MCHQMIADKTPLVSVIVPTYNSELTIIRCLDSILCQRGSFNLEVIIYDDCSSDQTVSLVRDTYGDCDFIKIYQSSINSGSGFSRNQSLSLCRGDYIAFLDSDDFWLPCKLSTQLYDFSTSSPNMIISYSSFLRLSPRNCTLVSPPSVLYFPDLKFINHIPMSSVLFKSSILPHVDYPLIRLRNDYLFWHSILFISSDYFAKKVSSKPFFVYDGMAGISSNKFKLLGKQFIFYRRHFHYSNFLSSYGVMLNIIRRLFS